jgi:hypothetical protein
VHLKDVSKASKTQRELLCLHKSKGRHRSHNLCYCNMSRHFMGSAAKRVLEPRTITNFPQIDNLNFSLPNGLQCANPNSIAMLIIFSIDIAIGVFFQSYQCLLQCNDWGLAINILLLFLLPISSLYVSHQRPLH